jgi:hypothetical protein
MAANGIDHRRIEIGYGRSTSTPAGGNAQIAAIPGRLGERVKSALRSPIEVQNGRVERNAGLVVSSRSCSTGPHRVCQTGAPGATPRGQGLTDLVHVDEYDWRGEEREHLGHQQSADDRIT